MAYQHVCLGVDMVFHGNQSQVEHDFTVQPGSDPAQIRLRRTCRGTGRAPATRRGKDVRTATFMPDLALVRDRAHAAFQPALTRG